MNIQPIQSGAAYQMTAAGKTQAVRGAGSAEGPAPRTAAPDFDEYIPGDRTGLEHSGFYEPVPGENGPGLRFDAPEDGPAPGRAATSSGDKARRTTMNTDWVDREIEKLRAQREKLVRQLRSAAPEQAGRLQKRLSQLENELRQKDNDTYRRAHAVIS